MNQVKCSINWSNQKLENGFQLRWLISDFIPLEIRIFDGKKFTKILIFWISQESRLKFANDELGYHKGYLVAALAIMKFLCTKF